MKKSNLFRLLWLPALMASLGLALLFTQFSLFQGHNPSHNQAVIATYYIYDPVTGYAVAKVTHYQDGCHITDNMEPAPKGSVSAVVDLFDRSGKSVGKWVCYPDKSKYWVASSADRSPLMLFTGSQIDDLLAARNKRRPSEKFFLL